MNKIRSNAMKSLLATLCATLLLNASLANPVLAMDDQDIQMQGVGKGLAAVADPGEAAVVAANPGYALPIAIGAYAVLATAALVGVSIGWGTHSHTPCNTTGANGTEPNCTDVVEYAHQCQVAWQCFLNASGFGPSIGY